MPKALLKCSIVADHGKPLDNSTTIATPGADWKAFMTFEIDKALVPHSGSRIPLIATPWGQRLPLSLEFSRLSPKPCRRKQLVGDGNYAQY